MNQPTALKPTRPSALVSPICAMPATRVANTSGAITILIRFRKMVVTTESLLAISPRTAPLFLLASTHPHEMKACRMASPFALSSQPARTPSTRPARI